MKFVICQIMLKCVKTHESRLHVKTSVFRCVPVFLCTGLHWVLCFKGVLLPAIFLSSCVSGWNLLFFCRHMSVDVAVVIMTRICHLS